MRFKEWSPDQVVSGYRAFQSVGRDNEVQAVVGQARLGAVGKSDESPTVAVFEVHDQDRCDVSALQWVHARSMPCGRDVFGAAERTW